MKLLTLNLVLFILIINSCNPTLKNKNNERFKSIKSNIQLNGISNDCSKYIVELKKSWKYNEVGNCYYDTEGLRQSILNNDNCFKTLSSVQIASLLGQANNVFFDDKNGAKILTYYLGKKCDQIYPYKTIHFLYNRNDSLMRVSMGQISID